MTGLCVARPRSRVKVALPAPRCVDARAGARSRVAEPGRRSTRSPLAAPETARRGFGAGFTLLEMMIAVAILALIFAMLAQSFHAVAVSKVRGENRLAVDRQGRAIIWRLTDEFQNTVQTPIYPSNVLLIGTARMQSRIPIDSVTLSTFGAGHERAMVGFGAGQLVTYATSPNPNHPGWYVLTRSQASALLSAGAGGPAPLALIMADNVVSLHLRYYNGTRWVESWNSTQLPRNQQLPLAVSIDLQLADSEGHVRDFATEVDVPMAQPLW